MGNPSLVLGSFMLMNPAGTVKVMAEGTSRGAPVPIEVAVKSWLQDGSIVVTQGYDNREVSLRVRMYGDDLTALAQSEAALMAELAKPNTLTWTPVNGPASVFVVVTSSLEYIEDDYAEATTDPWRTYNLRLVCEAFVRSAAQVTVAALPASGSTTTTLDTMGATTGWTGTINGVSTTVTNTVGPPTTNSITQAAVFGTYDLRMSKTFAATTTTTKLLMVDWQPSITVGSAAGLVAIGDGVTLGKIAEQASPTAGFTRTWFYVSASSLAALTLSWSTTLTESVIKPAPARTLKLDNIAVTDVNPTFGTGRQQARTVAVSGSARAQGALAVESPTNALGDALVYVYPRDTSTFGYIPSMRQYRSSGNTQTSDSTLVSGFSEPMNNTTPVVFNAGTGVFPAGTYVLVGRFTIGSPDTTTITYTTSTVVGSAVKGSLVQTRDLSLTTSYQVLTLGKILLPTVDVSPTSGPNTASIRLSVLSSKTITYDELWLFNTSIGALTWVSCGTGSGSVGGSARRLFLDPASIGTPRPTVRIGHSADRSDAYYPDTFPSWQFPQFTTPEVNVFTATTNATDAAVSFSYSPRWHTHAAS